MSAFASMAHMDRVRAIPSHHPLQKQRGRVRDRGRMPCMMWSHVRRPARRALRRGACNACARARVMGGPTAARVMTSMASATSLSAPPSRRAVIVCVGSVATVVAGEAGVGDVSSKSSSSSICTGAGGGGGGGGAGGGAVAGGLLTSFSISLIKSTSF